MCLESGSCGQWIGICGETEVAANEKMTECDEVARVSRGGDEKNREGGCAKGTLKMDRRRAYFEERKREGLMTKVNKKGVSPLCGVYLLTRGSIK